MSRRAPKASIDPDVRKSWLRRALPLVKAHRALLITSLTLSFAGLIVQVQIPNLVRVGIDEAIDARTANLTVYVWAIIGLALLQGLINYLAANSSRMSRSRHGCRFRRYSPSPLR